MYIAVDLLDGKGFNLATLILAGLALLMGTLAVYYGRKALFPAKRQLAYQLERSSPILDRSGLDPNNGVIEVRRNGVPLVDPHLAVVWVKNTGRHAIASEQFDQGRPLELDLQTPIVELLTVEAAGVRSLANACSVSGKSILFGPELIKRGQTITVTVLTEGSADLVVREHFIDVSLSNVGRIGVQGHFVRTVGGSALLSALAATAGLLVNILT